LKKCSATQLQTVQSNFENLCSFINDQIWEVLGKFFVRDGEVKLSLSAWWPTKSFIFRLQDTIPKSSEYWTRQLVIERIVDKFLLRSLPIWVGIYVVSR
jgi:hypothetical protein